jgi:hypothetical protein
VDPKVLKDADSDAIDSDIGVEDGRAGTMPGPKEILESSHFVTRNIVVCNIHGRCFERRSSLESDEAEAKGRYPGSASWTRQGIAGSVITAFSRQVIGSCDGADRAFRCSNHFS